MEKEFLRYVLSTILPILILGGGFIILKSVKKWEKIRKQKYISPQTTYENNTPK